MKKILFANGDSWTFGSEIAAPEFMAKPGEKGAGMGNRLTFDGADYHPSNDYYRIPRVWPAYLGKLQNFDEVINKGWPGRSNDTIYRSTLYWLMNEYDPKIMDATVVVGWSSPERKNVVLEDKGNLEEVTIWPGMLDSKYYESSVSKKYFQFHVSYLWTQKEAITRFVDQNFALDAICKSLGVKHYFFNSFYVPSADAHFSDWQDIDFRESIERMHENGLKGWKDGMYTDDQEVLRLLSMWDNLADDVFLNKKKGESFKSYCEKNVPADIAWAGIHPSPESHESWAEFISSKMK